MPRKNKCFSKCRDLSVRRCRRTPKCKTVKGYGRRGYKRVTRHCRLRRSYRM